MVREELQREKLRRRTADRAWDMEKRLEEGRGSEVARKSSEEMKDRALSGKGRSKWEEERMEFFRERE